MKRWAIAKLGDYDGDGNLVPAFNKHSCNSRIWTKTGFAWCFGQIAAADVSTIAADPDIYVLPDGTMDLSVGSIPVNVRTTMRTRLEAAGFVFTAVKTSWTVRQLLQYLKDQIQTGSIEAGDLIDVEA